MRKWEISEGGINEFGMRNERIRNLDWGMRVKSEFGMRNAEKKGFGLRVASSGVWVT
jgi:hypothetical protein